MKFDETYGMLEAGKKTETTRIPAYKWLDWYEDYADSGKIVLAEGPQGEISRIQVLDVFVTTLGRRIDDPQAMRKEGFESASGFIEVWKKMHGIINPTLAVCVIRFELVK